MAIFKIDDKNELYYEYVPPKNGGFTCVFVNALTGDVSAWNGSIGENLIKNNDGYLVYNFRGQAKSKFETNLDLSAELIVSDLVNLVNFVNPKNMVLVGLSIGGLYAAMSLSKGVEAKGLVLINTLRKPSERLNWINNAMANAVKFGGTSLILDMTLPVIASPKFLSKMKNNALKYENYLGLDDYTGVSKLMHGGYTTSWDFDWNKLDLPVLVMTGHYDKVFRIEDDINDLIKKLGGIEERVYRFRCVEAWSMTVPWAGFPLNKILSLVEPKKDAKFLKFETFYDPEIAPGQKQKWYPWPYQEGITIEEAKNELSFLATGIYGKKLPNQNGAPLRLVLPWKYGFKSIKSIVKISFLAERPIGLWEKLAPNEYGFWANVNPKVSHPRWSQETEQQLGIDGRIPTVKYNGYEEQVSYLYKGLEKTLQDKLFR